MGWAIILCLLSLFAVDLTTNLFFSKQVLGVSGSSEKSRSFNSQDHVDTRLDKEIWLGDPKYGATLQAAVTAIGSTTRTLAIPPGTHNIRSNLTIPNNVTLRVPSGAIINVDRGVTLSINGPIVAGLWQIFSGDGSVIGNSQVECVFPQWFGAKADGATDDSPAINKAAVFARATVARDLHFPKVGAYKTVLQQLDLTRLNISGQGEIITNYPGEAVVCGKLQHGIIRLTVTRPSQDWTAGRGNIVVKGVYNCKLYLSATNAETGIKFSEDLGNASMNCIVQLGAVYHNKIGLYVYNPYINHDTFTHHITVLGGHFFCKTAGAIAPVKMSRVPKGEPVAFWTFINPQLGYQVSGAVNGFIFEGAEYNNVYGAYAEGDTGSCQVLARYSDYARNNSIELKSYDKSPVVEYADKSKCVNNDLKLAWEIPMIVNPYGTSFLHHYSDGANLHFPGFGVFGGVKNPGNSYRTIVAGPTRYLNDDGHFTLDGNYGVGLKIEFKDRSRKQLYLRTQGQGWTLYVRCFNPRGSVMVPADAGNYKTFHARGRQNTWQEPYKAYQIHIEPTRNLLSFHPDVASCQIFVCNGTNYGQFELYSPAKVVCTQDYTGPIEMPGRYFASQPPAKWHFQVGEQVLNDAAAAGGTPGWVCVKRVETTLTAALSSGDKTLHVVSTKGMAVGDILGVKLNSGDYHFTAIAELRGDNVVNIIDRFPVGKVAATGNAVVVNLWKAMAHLSS